MQESMIGNEGKLLPNKEKPPGFSEDEKITHPQSQAEVEKIEDQRLISKNSCMSSFEVHTAPPNIPPSKDFIEFSLQVIYYQDQINFKVFMLRVFIRFVSDKK